MAHVEVHSPDNNRSSRNQPRYAADQRETPSRDLETSAKAVSSVGFIEAVGGAAAVVLPILGLLGIIPLTLAGVTTIILGAAFIIEGLGISTRARHLMQEARAGRGEGRDVGGGVTADFLGGGAGVALGILGLIGIAPNILLPVAAVVFGATLVFSSGVKADLATFGERRERDRVDRGDTRGEERSSGTIGYSKAAMGIQVLAGIAAVIIGILVLVGFTGAAGGLTLTHIAFLCVGVALVLSGTALGARMMTALR
jgi:hypothetical protein